MLHGDWSSASGYQAGLALPDECTAVFAANDQMALGILRALRERRIAARQHVSVVGFDVVPEAASYCPPLTTIHQDFAQVGRRCVDKALRQIEGHGPEAGRTLVPTSLVVRDSTAPPAG